MLQTSKQYPLWILIFLGTCQIFNEESEVGMAQICTAGRACLFPELQLVRIFILQ